MLHCFSSFLLSLNSLNLWKQPPEVFYKKVALKNFFFNEVADLRPATLLKKKFWHRCISVNFAKFLITHFSHFLQISSGRLPPNLKFPSVCFFSACKHKHMIFFTGTSLIYNISSFTFLFCMKLWPFFF